MKKNRIIAAIAASAAAFTMTAVQGSAFIKASDTPTEFVKVKDDATWILTLDADENSPFSGCTKIEAVVELAGDTDKYFEDKQNAPEEAEDDENAFHDFAGCIALNAKMSGEKADNEWWIQYNYLSPEDAESDGTTATVKKLNKTAILLSAEFDGIIVDGAAGDPAVNIMEWNNKVEDYWLEVKELYVYGADGAVTLYCDGAGNLNTDGHDPFDPSAYASEEAETPAETTAAETTTTTAAPETTTAAAQTDVAETTAAAAENAPVNTASAAASTDFGSRDSTLVIVGVVAGVVIVGIIVALIIIMGKKKK